MVIEGIALATSTTMSEGVGQETDTGKYIGELLVEMKTTAKETVVIVSSPAAVAGAMLQAIKDSSIAATRQERAVCRCRLLPTVGNLRKLSTQTSMYSSILRLHTLSCVLWISVETTHPLVQSALHLIHHHVWV